MKMSHFPMTVTMAAVVTTLLAIAGGDLRAADPYQPALPMPVNVLVISYFPVKGDRIDISKTGDWDAPLEVTRKNVAKQTAEARPRPDRGLALSRLQGQSAKPSLEYKVIDTIEYLEAGPLIPLKHSAANGSADRLRRRPQSREHQEVRRGEGRQGGLALGLPRRQGRGLGIRHGGPLRQHQQQPPPDDMPKYSKTYTLYHYNYQRGTSEAIEDHIHQIEAVLNYVDGRDHTPPGSGLSLLFWGKFVGSDATQPHHPPRLRLGALSAQRRRGLRLGQQTLRRDQHRGLASRRERQEATHELRPLARRQPELVHLLDAKHPRRQQRPDLPRQAAGELVGVPRRFRQRDEKEDDAGRANRLRIYSGRYARDERAWAWPLFFGGP